MCVTCGCGETAPAHGHDHHDHSHGDDHHHHHAHEHEHEHVMPDGTVVKHAHHHGPSEADERESRRIKVEQDILGRNDAIARLNRQVLAERGTFAVNLMSSPGSGKTTLLVKTLTELKGSTPCAVIEGDQQTDLDAKRIEATGVKAVQINTGKGCHLDAAMVGGAFKKLPPPEKGVLFIENVGNLVCPASFDLGEKKKVVVVSITEGEDKPLKYPDMFAVADLVLVNKIDLAPHLDFDLPKLEANVRRVCPGVKILRVSAKTGEGFGEWLGWLRQGV
jgi:hydrogenase nickel incorporation protein HypB